MCATSRDKEEAGKRENENRLKRHFDARLHFERENSWLVTATKKFQNK